jgi:hypothetical protein
MRILRFLNQEQGCGQFLTQCWGPLKVEKGPTMTREFLPCVDGVNKSVLKDDSTPCFAGKDQHREAEDRRASDNHHTSKERSLCSIPRPIPKDTPLNPKDLNIRKKPNRKGR